MQPIVTNKIAKSKQNSIDSWDKIVLNLTIESETSNSWVITHYDMKCIECSAEPNILPLSVIKYQAPAYNNLYKLEIKCRGDMDRNDDKVK